MLEVTPGPTQLPTPTTQDTPLVCFSALLRGCYGLQGGDGGFREGRWRGRPCARDLPPDLPAVFCLAASSLVATDLFPDTFPHAVRPYQSSHPLYFKNDDDDFKKSFMLYFFNAATLLLESARRILYGRTKLRTKLRTRSLSY